MKKYKTKNRMPLEGTLVIYAQVFDYNGTSSYQEGVATSSNVAEDWDRLVFEAQLNATYKHMAYKNYYFSRKSEDGASVDTYVKDIVIDDWYILYYSKAGDLSFNRETSFDVHKKKHYVYKVKSKSTSITEIYPRELGKKSDLQDISTRSFIVEKKPRKQVKRKITSQKPKT